VIRGLNENVCFLRAVCDHPRFLAGELTTEFIPDEYPDGFNGITLNQEQEQELFATAVYMQGVLDERGRTVGETDSGQMSAAAWSALLNEQDGEGQEYFCGYLGATPDEMKEVVAFTGMGEDAMFFFNPDESKEDAEPLVLNTDNGWDPSEALMEFQTGDESAVRVQYVRRLPEGFRLKYLGNTFDVVVRSRKANELSRHMIPKVALDTSSMVIAPMPGLLVSIAVEVGDAVEAGQEICVIEAMKMQNVLRAEKKGVVKEILVAAGGNLAVDELIVQFEG